MYKMCCWPGYIDCVTLYCNALGEYYHANHLDPISITVCSTNTVSSYGAVFMTTGTCIGPESRIEETAYFGLIQNRGILFSADDIHVIQAISSYH